MKILLSPSKTLDFDNPAKFDDFTQPKFLNESKQLISDMKKKSPEELSKLMKISDKLADLNYERYQSFKTPFTQDNAKQCIFAFKGDVYEGLEAETFSKDDLDFAQDHLRILSGLYGLLSPKDLMQPYRLEMGTRLKPSLYEFWDDKLTKELKDDLVINLASNEYFKAVKPKNLLTINFKEQKGDELKIVAIYAKKARGMMSKYIIKNKITSPEKIKNFNESGYEYRPDLSDDKNYIFAR